MSIRKDGTAEVYRKRCACCKLYRVLVPVTQDLKISVYVRKGEPEKFAYFYKDEDVEICVECDLRAAPWEQQDLFEPAAARRPT